MVSRLLQDIDKLRSMGVKIEYRKRSDGGYLITKINGQRFTGAKGNAEARRLAGSKISGYRATQLRRINEYSKKKKAPYSIDDEIRRAQNRVNRKRSKNKIVGGGYIGKKKIKYNLEHYGKEETLLRLQDAERYAEGYSYLANVEWLLDRLNKEKDFSDSQADEWQKIIDYVEAHKLKFRETDLSEIYNILGSPKAKNAEMGNKEADKVKKIKTLLNIE